MAEYGLDFAAEAAVWISGVGVSSSVVSGSGGGTWNPIHLTVPEPNDPGPLRAYNVLRRVRAHLATASEEHYRATVQRLGTLRGVAGGRGASGHIGDLWVRVATSYLLPTEQVWIDADLEAMPIDKVCSSPPERHQHWYSDDFGASSFPSDSDSLALLAASATTAEQLTRITEVVEPATLFRHVHNIATQVGPAAADVIAAMLDARLHAPYGWGARQRSTGELADMLSRFPTDVAMELLQARADNGLVFCALSRSASRFPRRAMRLLSADPAHTASAHIVQALESREQRSIRDASAHQSGKSGHLRNAEPHELSDVLAAPPWHRRSPSTQRLSLEKRPDRPLRLVWRPGQRERWAAMRVTGGRWYEHDLLEVVGNARDIEDYRRSVKDVDQEPFALALISDDIARPILREFQVPRRVHSHGIFQRILGRFGTDALDAVVATMAQHPSRMAMVMEPIDGSRVAVLMMRCLGFRRTHHAALTWWRRHADTAVADLIPIALGRQGSDRMLAQHALHTIAQMGHRSAIDSAATDYGQQARAAITTMVGDDAILSLPRRIPRLPTWLVPGLLPPILLADGSAALPESAVEDFCTMLAICRPEWQYAGVRVVAETVDPAALAEFAWGLYKAWMLAGCPHSDKWVLHTQGIVGNTDTARRLCQQILKGGWRIGESSRAALDAITAIGGDEAVTCLRAIASASSGGLARKARHRIRELTEPDSVR
ncbi:hypothetical protein [Nocardia sp. NBC_01009]|uniref:hypothetical protein n=1 Tax=Nocardia sp. NBC_01009 TaxID=2975996 RepID=UPI003865FAB0|nr:hypothetical protein OHA42_09865 [Nocardia sp. NBC_01009]